MNFKIVFLLLIIILLILLFIFAFFYIFKGRQIKIQYLRCFGTDGLSRYIQGLLIKYALEKRAQDYKDIVSILLCSIKYGCDTGTLKLVVDKYWHIVTPSDKEQTLALLTYNPKREPGKFLEIVTAATRILLKYSKSMMSKDDYELLKGYTYQLCATSYPEFYISCGK